MKSIGFNDQPPLELYFKHTTISTQDEPRLVERAIKSVEKISHAEVFNRKSFNRKKITKLQENILKYFEVHPKRIIMKSNNDLTPYMMTREEYIKNSYFNASQMINSMKESAKT